MGPRSIVRYVVNKRVERWELGGGTSVQCSLTLWGLFEDYLTTLSLVFSSTLEETIHCQLLLIIIDASDAKCLVTP